MNINVKQGQLTDVAADTLIVNLFLGVTTPSGATGAVDGALDGAISNLIAMGDITGKAGEITTVYTRGAISAKRVLVVGLGTSEEFDVEGIRNVAGSVVSHANKLGANHVATIVHGAGIGGIDVAAAATATIEGTLLAMYAYDAPKQKARDDATLTDFTIVELDADKAAAISDVLPTVEKTVAGTILARDLVNGPSNIVTPEYLAEVAVQLANDYHFGVTVGDRDWAAEQGMGAFLGVSMGTAREPAFIVLEHKPEGVTGAPVVIVGKGMTFDTGGISLKPGLGMQDMISDMGGAAAVLGTMKAVGELNLQKHVIAIAACTENMPDGEAYRPGDVLTAMNGKTIEITNTDAEGRLVLADALAYAAQFEPAAVVDLATLTGAAVVALGSDTCAGLFGNDADLVADIRDAGDRTFERVWELPLYKEFGDAMKSDVADLKNAAAVRWGGASSGAAFLKEFVSYPWVHLDIAPMAYSAKNRDYIPKGATGFGVRLLIDWLSKD